VIEVKYPDFVIDYLAPFTTGEKIFYAIVKGNPKKIKALQFTQEAMEGVVTQRVDDGAIQYFLFSSKMNAKIIPMQLSLKLSNCKVGAQISALLK